MKIVSFNVNSVRQRQHQLEALISKHAPDIIGLQETKVTDEDFPVEDIESLGYHVAFHGQKTHYGVAMLCKKEPLNVIKGFSTDSDEAQRRWIGVEYPMDNGETLHVYNGYFPQGEARDHADNAKRWLRSGKTSFLPEEREWLQKLADWGLTDTYRHLYPESTDYFSWFDYRSKGFDRDPKRGLRIDHLYASASLMEKLQDSGVDYDIRAMEKPSDHCPVWSAFNFEKGQ